MIIAIIIIITIIIITAAVLRQQVPREQVWQQDHHQPGQRPVPGLPVQDLHHGDDPLQGQQGDNTVPGKTKYKNKIHYHFQLRSSLTENPPSSITMDGNSHLGAA